MVFRPVRLEIQKAWHVVCVPTIAESVWGIKASVDSCGTLREGWFVRVARRRAAWLNGIMILYLRTVLLGGFVQAAPALDIQNMLIAVGRR